MNNLVNIYLNQDGQAVVTSRQIAEDFEKEHSSVVVRAIENLIKELKGSRQNCTHLFIETEYQNEQNKQWYKEYLLTRDGFSLLVMGFTGPKALQWKLKYIEAFNKMEKALKEPKQLTPMEQLKLQYQVIEEHEEKLNTIESDVKELKNNMVINHGQEVTIKKTVDKRIKEICYGSGSPAYLDKSLRAKAYRTLWRDYKAYFNITSYHDTLKKDFARAIEIIEEWKPSGGLLRDIRMSNSQMTF